MSSLAPHARVRGVRHACAHPALEGHLHSAAAAPGTAAPRRICPVRRPTCSATVCGASGKMRSAPGSGATPRTSLSQRALPLSIPILHASARTVCTRTCATLSPARRSMGNVYRRACVPRFSGPRPGRQRQPTSVRAGWHGAEEATAGRRPRGAPASRAGCTRAALRRTAREGAAAARAPRSGPASHDVCFGWVARSCVRASPACMLRAQQHVPGSMAALAAQRRSEEALAVRCLPPCGLLQGVPLSRFSSSRGVARPA